MPITSHGWPRRTPGGATRRPVPRAVPDRTRPVRHVPPPAWVHPGPANPATPRASRPLPAGPSAPASAILATGRLPASGPPPGLVPGPRSSHTIPRVPTPAPSPLPRSACGPARSPAAPSVRPYTPCSGSGGTPPPSSLPPLLGPRALSAAAAPLHARVSTPLPSRRLAGRTSDTCVDGPHRRWAATPRSARSWAGSPRLLASAPCSSCRGAQGWVALSTAALPLLISHAAPLSSGNRSTPAPGR